MPSTTRISNGIHTNTAPHIRESAATTCNIPPPKVASTVRTSNVSHHHVLHAACATRITMACLMMIMRKAFSGVVYLSSFYLS
ncbi:hypothetical protein P8452_42340 [Trifolium repens]|jgi:hypothetical protein|nr:hypothetical protein QL285_046248 [Trifolium repens]KAK2428275.1 hypothetical protein QL285_026807 [Trifolium repens]WJX27371.1 hypothetical protein P8452_16195 [Trifolium repens]WJX45149.1 hypothetical protein P8452_32050 [Trifolium repens]WJX56706.1 hypothetical protein P8452_42340 [Trifolium repens]